MATVAAETKDVTRVIAESPRARDKSRVHRKSTEPDRRKLALLEGHVRPSAYGAFPEFLPAELEIYLGISPNARWCPW